MCSRGNRGAGRWAQVWLPALAVWILPVLWGCGSADDVLHSWTGHRAADGRDSVGSVDLLDVAPGEVGNSGDVVDEEFTGTDSQVGDDTIQVADATTDLSWIDTGREVLSGQDVDVGHDSIPEVVQGDSNGPVGYWRDPLAELDWENPPRCGKRSLSGAEAYCDWLPLDGGGWRVPRIGELRSLIRGCGATEFNGICGVEESCLYWTPCRDNSCDGCSAEQGPADGCYWPDGIEGTCGGYWSQSLVQDNLGYAFSVVFGSGRINPVKGLDQLSCRCVRYSGEGE